MTAKIQTVLMLASANLAIAIDGKTQAEVLKEVKDAGQDLGAKSLKQLMDGKVKEVKGWTVSKQEVADEQTTVEAGLAGTADTTTTDAGTGTSPADDLTNRANEIIKEGQAGNAEAGSTETLAPADNSAAPAPASSEQTPVAQAASEATGAKGTGRAKKPTLWERIVAAGANPAANNAAKYEGLTEEQKKLAMEQEAANPTNGGKVSYRGTDWSKVLPHEPVPVKRDSKMHKFFEFLTKEGGVTKDEILKEFGWSAGGLAGIIHWEPKSKGYVLHTEKKDGKIHYRLKYHLEMGGAFVKPGEVKVAEPKPAPAPKAPKAPKAAAATDGTTSAPAPQGKVRVPKDGMQQAGATLPMGGASVTKRVAKRS